MIAQLLVEIAAFVCFSFVDNFSLFMEHQKELRKTVPPMTYEVQCETEYEPGTFSMGNPKGSPKVPTEVKTIQSVYRISINLADRQFASENSGTTYNSSLEKFVDMRAQFRFDGTRLTMSVPDAECYRKEGTNLPDVFLLDSNLQSDMLRPFETLPIFIQSGLNPFFKNPQEDLDYLGSFESQVSQDQGFDVVVSTNVGRFSLKFDGVSIVKMFVDRSEFVSQELEITKFRDGLPDEWKAINVFHEYGETMAVTTRSKVVSRRPIAEDEKPALFFLQLKPGEIVMANSGIPFRVKQDGSLGDLVAKNEVKSKSSTMVLLVSIFLAAFTIYVIPKLFSIVVGNKSSKQTMEVAKPV